MKLHIACGKRILSGWINRDLKRPPKDTLPFDATKRWEYNSGTAEMIYCEDFLEHLSQPDQFIFLSECYRVLCIGGILRINVPDIIWSLKNWIIDNTKEGIDSLDLDREFYNSREGHKFLPTSSYLIDILPLFGFKKIVFFNKDESSDKNFIGDSRPVVFSNKKINREKSGNLYMEAIK